MKNLKIHPNPMSVGGTPMHTKFIEACRSNPALEVELVFHGTADANIDPICASGLDPKKRGTHGQALGPGEYFSRDPLVCLQYCTLDVDGEHEASGRLLIFAVLINPKSDRAISPVVVVNEPDHQLPLAVLTFGSEQSIEVRRRMKLIKTMAEAAKAAEEKAARAAKDADDADAHAQAADACADVCQHLIREELAEAFELYAAACEANEGHPPDWAANLQPYLKKYKFEFELFPGAFPSATGSSSGGGPSQHRERDLPPSHSSSGARHQQRAAERRQAAGPPGIHTLRQGKQPVTGKRRFDGTVKELESRAHALREEAERLSAEAKAARAAEVATRAAEEEPTSNLALSSASAPPPAPSAPPSPPKAPTPAATRRIMHELSQMRRADPSIVVSVPDDGDCYTWHAELSLDEATPLGRDLCNYAAATGGAATVQLELTFNGGYPSVPPFVRVMSPRFAFHTGHVTVGGSICMQELTTSAWSAEMTIEGVLLLVRAALVEGGGRLDAPNAHIPYSQAEAREAFARASRAHGWQ